MKKTDKVKDRVQREAVQAIINAGGRGIVVKATGAGKSRVPILYLQEKKITKVALIVPTEELRDNNWEKEFQDWGAEDIYLRIDRLCYASASKVEGNEYDLVILDECHHITPLSAIFFDNNVVKDIIALTATLPTDMIKKNILKGLGVNPVYTLSIDEAQELGLVAPFKIKVIYTRLDSTQKNVKAGSKAKPFYQTEYAAYSYITRLINELQFEDFEKDGAIFGVRRSLTSSEQGKLKMLILKRMRLIYNLKSKTEMAKKLISELLDKDDRTLIFCGSIEQAEELCPFHYHSKVKKSNNDLERFKEGKINQMSCVNALNEGINIPNLDKAIVAQVNSQELNLVQRIGRIIRIRPGHEALIYILCCKDTQDEVWLQKSLENFNSDNISYINYIKV